MTHTTKDLTVREREVLKFLVEGLSSREIAEKLYISINTVQYHRKQLLHKTDSRNVAELIGKAYRFKLIDLDWCSRQNHHGIIIINHPENISRDGFLVIESTSKKRNGKLN